MTEQLVQVREAYKWTEGKVNGEPIALKTKVLQIRHRLLTVGSTGTLHVPLGEPQWGEWTDVATEDGK